MANPPEEIGDAAEMTADVIFGTRMVGDGLYLGLILLNRPAQLNAITTEMFTALNRQLDSWERDSRVVGLGIAGGGTGFCAGGDVVALRNALLESDDSYVDGCFEQEYLLDSRLRAWSAPVVVLAHGVCMGGGFGLLMAGSHRVVTATTKIAMPETRIGFYPDVGSCGFLNQLPLGMGRTLALSGTSIDAEDAVQLGMATACLAEARRSMFWDAIADQAWSDDNATNHRVVDEAVEELTRDGVVETRSSCFMQHVDQFALLGAADGVAEFGALASSLADQFALLQPVADGYQKASPTSLALTDRYFTLSQDRSPQEVLGTDEILSKRFVRFPDFAEGVRTVLVAKGDKPCWEYSTVDDVDPSLIDRLLAGL